VAHGQRKTKKERLDSVGNPDHVMLELWLYAYRSVISIRTTLR